MRSCLLPARPRSAHLSLPDASPNDVLLLDALLLVSLLSLGTKELCVCGGGDRKWVRWS